MSNLAPIRRIVTGHTSDGKSTVIEDARIEPRQMFPGSETLTTDIFWTDSTPASNDVVFKDLVKDHPSELFPSDGSSFRVIEMPPGQRSPFHRTVSLDYGIVTHGQLTLFLDDDKRVTLSPGDVFIQRGTIHSWLNEGNECVRMYGIMLPSKKVKIGDKELDAFFPKPSTAGQKK